LIHDAEQLVGVVRGALLEKKGLDPAILDVRGLSSVTDFFVIVSGGSPPHLKALASEVRARAHEAGYVKGRGEGDPASGWVVLDLGDAVVHVFLPATRAYYALEELWNDAPRWDDIPPRKAPRRSESK
jgi:ribosome-associated protein